MRPEARQYYDKKLEALPDAQDRLFARVIPADISGVKKIHLSGVCGTAMGSLATLLAKKGYQLSGSDEGCYPPMDKIIRDLGIEFREGFKKEHVHDADVVIVGNICRANNPEAEEARSLSKPTLSLPEAIEKFFIADKKSLVVCGTHGKTTTTALLSHVFISAGKKPGYMIGGVLQGEEQNAEVGEGAHFIIEGDEYDTSYFDKSPKFLHYKPHTAIITSVEFDHVDIYSDLEEYTRAFRFLAREILPEGSLVLCGDREDVRALSEQTQGKVILYGLEGGNDVTARDVEVSEKGQAFSLVIKEKDHGQFFIPLSGNHNLLNALAVCATALSEGITEDELREGLKTFRGVKRRQEIVAEVGGITILDDFAHHPTAVRETISAIKEKFRGRRLVAFFEPRSATSRRKLFENDYGHAFGLADLVFISTPILRDVDAKMEMLDPLKVVGMINEGNKKAYAVKNAEELLGLCVPLLQKGDVVLIMSNGAFDGIHAKLAASII